MSTTMSELASFLKAYMEERKISLREMEQRAGVSRSLVNNLINGKDIEPKLSTLEGIAQAIEIPLWRVIEMAGVNLGLPETPAQDAERLASLARRNDDLARLISHLVSAEPAQIRNILSYLESPAGDQVHDLRIAILSGRQRELVGRLLNLRPRLLPDLPQRQNVYEGANLTNERGTPIWVVTVNGVKLTEELGWTSDLTWGYLGSGPMALARAILSYEYDRETAERYRSSFYSEVTSTLPKGRQRTGRIWSLESQEIDLWLMLTRLIEGAEPAKPAKPTQPVSSDVQPG